MFANIEYIWNTLRSLPVTLIELTKLIHLKKQLSDIFCNNLPQYGMAKQFYWTFVRLWKFMYKRCYQLCIISRMAILYVYKKNIGLVVLLVHWTISYLSLYSYIWKIWHARNKGLLTFLPMYLYFFVRSFSCPFSLLIRKT